MGLGNEVLGVRDVGFGVEGPRPLVATIGFCRVLMIKVAPSSTCGAGISSCLRIGFDGHAW